MNTENGTEQFYKTWDSAPALLKIPEAASLLRVHRNTIIRLLYAGKIPGRKVGRSWRIDREELHAWFFEESRGEG